MKLTTTLNLLCKASACKPRYKVLVKSLGIDYDKDKEINLLTILEFNGLDDALWALYATAENCDKIARLMAADFAEESLKYWDKQYPNDDRPKNAIKAARDFANGLIDNNAADAAYAAADAADAADAAAAANAYAAAAANAYAADAAADAAYAAAYAAYAAADAAYAAAYAADAAADAADAAADAARSARSAARSAYAVADARSARSAARSAYAVAAARSARSAARSAYAVADAAKEMQEKIFVKYLS